MPKVNSTAIERITPRGPNRFRLRFHNQAVYDIDAPLSVYRALRHSRSVGRDYNALVKGRYTTTLVNG